MSWLIIIPVFFPIVAGFGLLIHGCESRAVRQAYVASVTIVNTAAVLAAVFLCSGGVTLLSFGDNLSLTFKIDGLGSIFACMSSVLWIPATFYAFEYMKHEGMETRFFSFWLISFGVTVGVAFAANPLTMYLFYELLTLATLPLVMHAATPKSRYAGRSYLLYSMSGAALAFASLVYLTENAPGGEFTVGGFLGGIPAGGETLYLTVFLLGFAGYGVKAALFPFSKWLTDASVAPTPVTSLLHAVAVVKAGVFSVMRLTWYSFGVEALTGTWAQYAAQALAAFTVMYGAFMALRSPHLKRRLAYSTVSNLSYMLVGVALMTPSGLTASIVHMLFHAFSKIVLFCCVGAVFYVSGREYVYETHGLGRRMPIIFSCFTVTALGLIGVPPLGGFTGKWLICTSAADVGTVWAFLGVGALLFSTLLTALYLLTVIFPAWLPEKSEQTEALNAVHEPGKLMTVPLIAISAAFVAMSLGSDRLIELVNGLIWR